MKIEELIWQDKLDMLNKLLLSGKELHMNGAIYYLRENKLYFYNDDMKSISNHVSENFKFPLALARCDSNKFIVYIWSNNKYLSDACFHLHMNEIDYCLMDIK